MKVVVIYNVRHEYYPNDLDFRDYRFVPHVVFHKCMIELLCYLQNLGFLEKADPPPPNNPAFEMWSQPDVRLKRISFYQCCTRYPELAASSFSELTLLDPKQLELFQATQSQYKISGKAVAPYENRFLFGAQQVHLLRTVVPFVTHSLISDYREMRALLSGLPVHPDMDRLDHAPDAISEYGRVLSGKMHRLEQYELNWYGE